jgi:hypothetical protein
MAAVSSNQLTSGFTLNHRMLYPVLVYISGRHVVVVWQERRDKKRDGVECREFTVMQNPIWPLSF